MQGKQVNHTKWVMSVPIEQAYIKGDVGELTRLGEN